MKYSLRIFFLSLLLQSGVRADTLTQGWTYNVGCPGAGSSFSSVFNSLTSGGFSGAGRCSRTSTNFTQFDYLSSAGGTLTASQLFGFHTFDTLIIPPTVNTDTAPIYTVAPICPFNSRDLNWIFVQWTPAVWDLTSTAVMGSANYSSTQITVTWKLNVRGNFLTYSPFVLPGSCTGGVFTLSNGFDQGGNVYLTYTGSGTYKTSAGHSVFFFPQATFTPSTALSTQTLPGILFDNVAASTTRNVRVTTDAAGTTWTVQPYSNPATGAIDGAYTDTIVIDRTDLFFPGNLRGTVTRTGTGAGTGYIACIAYKNVATRVVCSGQSPPDNTRPYSLVFGLSGAQTLSQETPNSGWRKERQFTPAANYSDGTRLFVADSTNNRVLIWNSIPTTSGVLPDVVLGQPHLGVGTANNGGRSASSLSGPKGVMYDGSKLFVADSVNDRVLIWNSLPTVNQTAANIVLGQADFATATAATTQTGMSNPIGIFSDGTRLLVTERTNRRTIYYSSIPTANAAPGTFVMGQPDWVTATNGTTASKFRAPSHASIRGTRIFVADQNNHRVLIFNNLPTANSPNADIVVGQSLMTTRATAATAAGMNSPDSAYFDGTRLTVSDELNNRVLIFNSLPTASGASANIAVGQTNLTNNGTGTTASTVNGPQHEYYDGSKLFVADTVNNRVLVFNSLPTASGASANHAVGAANLTTTSYAPTSLVSAPNGVHSDGTRLLVADYDNSRALIWSSMPSSLNQAPNFVVGQPDFVTNSTGSTASKSNQVSSVFSDGTRLFMAECGNNRVLIFNAIPTASGASANIVVGQTNTTNNGAATSQSGLSCPNSVQSDGTRLVVADRNNNRVMIWNTLPTASGANASFVVGQAAFGTSGTGTTATTLSGPSSAWSDGTRLFVADSANNRTLVYSALPTANGASATFAIGQTDLVSGTAGNNAARQNNPNFVQVRGTKIYVADAGRNRVLIYNSLPTAHGMSATAVLGQATLTAGQAGVDAESLTTPYGVYSDGSKVFVADYGNQRIQVFEEP